MLRKANKTGLILAALVLALNINLAHADDPILNIQPDANDSRTWPAPTDYEAWRDFLEKEGLPVSAHIREKIKQDDPADKTKALFWYIGRAIARSFS